VRLANRPELVERAWSTEFDHNPLAQDRNGDGAGDFVYSGGTNFDSNMVVDGVWSAAGYLRVDNPTPIATPVIVQFRGASRSTGGRGALARSLVRLDAAEFVDLTASLALEADGTQTALLSAFDGAADQPLTTVRNLPARQLDVRIVVEPTRRLASLQIDAVEYPLQSFPTISSGIASDAFYFTEGPAAGEFDYVRVEIKKP
jgi:hypothetical protein